MVLSSAISLLLGFNQFGNTDVSKGDVSQANVIPSAGVPSRDPEVAVPPPSPAAGEGVFNWTNVKPINNLDFRNMEKCFDNFLCARFNVPLDHSRSGSPNMTLAVSILPATATGPDEYKGILMLNPGGPGGSGVEFLTGSAPTLVDLVGPGYDLVAFDPRGTGSSLPLARCFTVEEWLEFSPDEVLSFDRRQDVALYLARSEIVANRCFEELGGTGEQKAGGTVKDWGVGYYLGSPDVANDMVLMMQALGQEQINYLGVSYGTALGQYFLAMHPDKVNLMMIDSVLDSEPWSKNELIETYQDTDEIIEAFYELCARAGPTVCLVAESTKEATKKRVNDILTHLDENPLVIMPHVDGSFVLTADSLRAVTTGTLYNPFTGFPGLAATLAAVEARETKLLANFGAKDRSGGLGDQTYQAISCVDRADARNSSFNEAVEWTKQADRTADFVDDAVARDQLMCVPWKMRPKNPFEGSFTPEGFNGKMLIISNMFDPVTPLSHARAVQKRTPNSSLLIQNGLGHSPLAKTGNCVDGAVSAFFKTGELPVTGTVCEPDALPFVGKVDEGIVPGAAGKEAGRAASDLGGGRIIRLKPAPSS